MGGGCSRGTAGPSGALPRLPLASGGLPSLGALGTQQNGRGEDTDDFGRSPRTDVEQGQGEARCGGLSAAQARWCPCHTSRHRDHARRRSPPRTTGHADARGSRPAPLCRGTAPSQPPAQPPAPGG